MKNQLLYAALDEQVTGHAEAKKALVVMIARMELRTHQRWVKGLAEEYLVDPLKILLLGRTGTGKSFLLHTLTQITGKPTITIDATHLIPSGAGSGIKPEKMIDMIRDAVKQKCEDNPHDFPYLETTLDQMIVVIDEIDKLGTAFEGSGNWNKHVQSSFLTIFDNKEALQGVSFVFMGAFDGITGHKEEAKNIGFQYNNTQTTKAELEDLVIKAGLIPELVGRMNAIIELDTFTKEDYACILRERIIPKKDRDLAAMGIFGHKMLSCEERIKLAERAYKSGQGIRFLKREVDKLFMDIEFEADRSDDILILGESE